MASGPGHERSGDDRVARESRGCLRIRISLKRLLESAGTDASNPDAVCFEIRVICWFVGLLPSISERGLTDAGARELDADRVARRYFWIEDDHDLFRFRRNEIDADVVCCHREPPAATIDEYRELH